MKYRLLSSSIELLLGGGIIVIIIIMFSALRNRRSESQKFKLFTPHILQSNCNIRSYKTQYAYYPAIRTFYQSHPHISKLPELKQLPLLVFVHGMGGSLAQFAFLLRSLNNTASCFGIDLPGCGLSDLLPTKFSAYAIEGLTDLIKVAVEEICRERGHGSVIFICHSMGCSIGATLTSSTTRSFNIPVRAMIAICPRVSPFTPKQSKKFRQFLSLPDLILNLIRLFDRIGGIESNSVCRFVGKEAGSDLKKLQLQYNKNFTTAAWKRIVMGILPIYDPDGKSHGGLPGREIWANIQVPLLLIGGESDSVTPPQEIGIITAYLQNTTTSSSNSQSKDQSHRCEHHIEPSGKTIMTDSQSLHQVIIRSTILPKPASHALMYDHATYRTVAGVIEDFLERNVSEKLSLGWQLQHLTTTGKWDVKNLAKWERIIPVSGPIGGGIFRALKTLRQQDPIHTPRVFLSRWKGKIFAVIDISHETPIYDTTTLNKGGIQYHKFPTVSKMPPSVEETQAFIALVDRLRKEIKIKFSDQDHSEHSIGVHCHYGFNRTGFFIVCYLVEKEGYGVQEALDDFALQKPPGIKHDHFIDTLFLRYHVGLRRASMTKRNDG